MDMFDWMRQEHELSQKKYPPEHDDEHGPDHLLEEVRWRLAALRPLLRHPEMARSTDAVLHELAKVGNIVGAIGEQFAQRRPEDETPWRTDEERGAIIGSYRPSSYKDRESHDSKSGGHPTAGDSIVSP